MTTRSLSILALSVASLAASVVPAGAVELGQIRVNVPFAFRAGTVTLPAGNYSFIRENQAGLVRISGSAGSIMLITHPGQMVNGNAEPSVAFHKGHGIAVLDQLRMTGDPSAIVPCSGRPLIAGSAPSSHFGPDEVPRMRASPGPLFRCERTLTPPADIPRNSRYS